MTATSAAHGRVLAGVRSPTSGCRTRCCAIAAAVSSPMRCSASAAVVRAQVRAVAPDRAVVHQAVPENIAWPSRMSSRVKRASCSHPRLAPESAARCGRPEALSTAVPRSRPRARWRPRAATTATTATPRARLSAAQRLRSWATPNPLPSMYSSRRAWQAVQAASPRGPARIWWVAAQRAMTNREGQNESGPPPVVRTRVVPARVNPDRSHERVAAERARAASPSATLTNCRRYPQR